MDKESMFSLGEKIIDSASGKIIEHSRNQPLGSLIGSTGACGHETKIGDFISEKIAIDILQEFSKKHPDHHIILISEEKGVMEFGDTKSMTGCFMILDPLDGSNNTRPWKTPSPCVTISLGIGSLNHLGKNSNLQCIDIGLVKEIFNNRLYYSKKGEGAFVKGFGKILSSPETEISNSIISIDLDLQSDKYKKKYSDLKNLLENRRYRRRSGSSILDFMKVACGEYDSFVSLSGRMKLSDVAAAKLIAEQAGATFEIIEKEPPYCIIKRLIETKDNNILKDTMFNIISSGNKELHKKVKNLCNLLQE